MLAPPVEAEQSPALPERITVRRVLDATAAHFDTTVETLRSPRRTQPLTRRRQLAMYVARRFTGRSLMFIASRVGKKDHTTVLHAHRVIKALLDARDAATVEAVDGITARLRVGGAHA